MNHFRGVKKAALLSSNVSVLKLKGGRNLRQDA